MGKLYLEISTSENATQEDFIHKMNEIGFSSQYAMKMNYKLLPGYRNEVIEYLIENGLTQLFQDQLNEGVLAPGSPFALEQLVNKYIQKIRPLKRLLIIDPYFYGASTSSHQLLERLLAPLNGELNELTLIVGNGGGANATNIKNAITRAVPAVALTEIQTTDFHDRFWINPESEQGLVMGTSLNGIGNRIALIDRLNVTDVRTLLSHARATGFFG